MTAADTVTRHDAPSRRRPGAALAVAVRGKGARHALVRAGAVAGQYGATTRRMDRRIHQLLALAGRYGAAPTLPVTASVVQHHPAPWASLVDRGAELAVHGLRHVDHLGLSAREQDAEVRRAVAVMRRAGVPVTGFRAPYLRADARTLAAVAGAGLRYDASAAVHWPLGGVSPTDAYLRGLAFYGARSVEERPSLPWWDEGVLRIPYSLPDDESFVVRLGLAPTAIREVWSATFETAHRAGQLLTVSVHPERVGACGAGIAAVLHAARDPARRVWVARLDDIASWWAARDRARLEVGARHDGRVEVRVHGPPGLTVLGRDLGVAGTTPWDDGLERVHARRLVVTADRVDGLHLGAWPDGARCALAVTGDVDALTLGDFARRVVGR